METWWHTCKNQIERNRTLTVSQRTVCFEKKRLLSQSHYRGDKFYYVWFLSMNGQPIFRLRYDLKLIFDKKCTITGVIGYIVLILNYVSYITNVVKVEVVGCWIMLKEEKIEYFSKRHIICSYAPYYSFYYISCLTHGNECTCWL